MIIAHPFEQQMACMDLTCGGVLEKYPKLRIAILESGGGWLAYWLARLDEFAEKIGHMLPPLTLKPSEYFHRQCFLSCEPDDVALKTAVALDTDKVLMWASDYPHFDCVFHGAIPGMSWWRMVNSQKLPRMTISLPSILARFTRLSLATKSRALLSVAANGVTKSKVMQSD